ncbi:EF-hand domain-containing protein [archaeon]|nr:MAG: EF-hand domain-containing protein [archaeon]
MYGQRKRLEQIFLFFDTNGDGVISMDELREGCALLNQSLPPDCQLNNLERTLQVMDFDGSGTIDINEFFEVRASFYQAC